jgi:DNA repair protein SbcD/Mre11
MSPKILATADWHLGSGSAYSDDRLADQEAVLNQIVDLAASECIDLILLAGDVMHRPRPTPSTLMVFRRFVDKMAALEIPTIACTGNASHDIESADRPCALDLFASHRFRVSRRPELITEFAGVAVATLPSVPVSRLVAGAESVDRGPVFAQAAEALLAIARELREQAGDRPCVLMGHWSVSGAALPNGLPVADLHEPILDLAAFERIGYDAIIAGHIHRYQELATDAADPELPVFYTGSPLPVDFGEADHPHGCVILEFGLQPMRTHRPRFVPLESRRFVTIDCDLTDTDAPRYYVDDTDDLAAAIAEHFPLTDAVVRLRYKATEAQQRRIDLPAIKKLIADAGAHRLFQIAPEIVREQRARVAGVDENLSPQEALKAWVEANGLSEDQAARLRELMETP